MLGDFNARTGTLSDFIAVDEIDSDLLGIDSDNTVHELFQNLNFLTPDQQNIFFILKIGPEREG